MSFGRMLVLSGDGFWTIWRAVIEEIAARWAGGLGSVCMGSLERAGMTMTAIVVRGEKMVFRRTWRRNLSVCVAATVLASVAPASAQEHAQSSNLVLPEEAPMTLAEYQGVSCAGVG